MILNMGTYAITDIFNDLGAYNGFQNPAPADAPADVGASFLSITNIISSFIGQWLSAPYDIFGQTTTKARKLTAALWGLNFVSPLSSLIFFVGSGELSQYNKLGVGVSC
ncbi:MULTISPECIES: hypothetical protein [Acidobacteriaceae]|uniref:hypothetical protein n=1 Tax=Acidobacteriaceae TaxID=204434 RepID=UPI001C206393|nr:MULTISPECIES: hypothetical protein [Acidobacteriaceae]MDW5265923.1 hypothetical protein [Edaphobacter sp.]